MQKMVLRFDDREQLTIDDSCVKRRFSARCRACPRGETLELMLHTNSDRVLEMRTGTNALMNFEASMAGLASEIRKYLWIGLLQYPIAGVGLWRWGIGRRGANRQKGRIEFVAFLWYNEGEKNWMGGAVMGRIKSLNRYQKGVLVFVTVMVLVFSILYPITLRRVGFEYRNVILTPSQENGGVAYDGTLDGQPTRFEVLEDGSVAFRHGGQSYGPYTAKEDPTAVPKGEDMEDLTGVELRKGDTVLFRGGAINVGGLFFLYDEDGNAENLDVVVDMNGVIVDEAGRPVDEAEPTAEDILALMAGPELKHKGSGVGWFVGTLLCAMTALSILFVDELFQWELSFRIQNADRAEPADWEIAARYIGWTVVPIGALIVFITGLQ